LAKALRASSTRLENDIDYLPILEAEYPVSLISCASSKSR